MRRCRVILFEHQAKVGFVNKGSLLIVVVDIWLMPLECLHMTALEITHSQTEQEVDLLVQTLNPKIPTVSINCSIILMENPWFSRAPLNGTEQHY